MDINYRHIINDIDLQQAIERLKYARVVGIDTKTTGLNLDKEKIRLLTIASDQGDNLVVDFKYITSLGKSHIIDTLNTVSVIILQNAKATMKLLRQERINLINVFDITTAAQILSCGNGKKDYGIERLAVEYLNLNLSKEFHSIDWSVGLTYEQLEFAARDAAVLLPLRKALIKRLQATDLINTAALEFDAIYSIVEMELFGIKVDRNKLQSIDTEMSLLEQRLFKQLCHLGLSNVNLNSHAQLLKRLGTLGIFASSTAYDELQKYEASSLVIKPLLEYKKTIIYRQLNRTLIESINTSTGRIHSSFYPLGTSSGRFSCSNPNIQQIPRLNCYRECFIPEDGMKFVIADYSQIELRIAAEISNDPLMIKTFCNDLDLHNLTASLITGKSLSEITTSDRQAAKAVNFGLLYGMGHQSLAAYARESYGINMTDEEAFKFRSLFFNNYKGLLRWHHETSMNKESEIRTLGGRLRRWDNRPSLMQLLNTPVQGTGADILKRALNLLYGALANTGARILAVVHDEIILEVPVSNASQVATILKYTMEKAGIEFIKKVPVVAEVRISDSWAEK